MRIPVLFLLLFLLFPSISVAEECCFKDPGVCSEITSFRDREACEGLRGGVVLDSSCKEAPECHISPEPPGMPPADVVPGSGSRLPAGKVNRAR